MPIASILLLTLAGPTASAQTPMLSDSTSRSLDDFASCFTRMQEEAGRPWAFVPTNSGGSFSNLGARGATEPYVLRIGAANDPQRVQLFAQGGGSDRLIQAVEQCK